MVRRDHSRDWLQVSRLQQRALGFALDIAG